MRQLFKTSFWHRSLCNMLILNAFCLVLWGCAGKPSASETRSQLCAGHVDYLTSSLEKSHTHGKDLNVALNLGRLYQLQGRWAESITAFTEAEFIIQEYESRAIINMREMGSDVGVFTLSRGSKGYFGAGYERSLLHTINAFNFIMLGDLDGAAVELKKMETRQEYWLAESAEKNLIADKNVTPIGSPDDLPAEYSAKNQLNTDYKESPFHDQDPFSYAVSAIVHAIVQQQDYADVSLARFETTLGKNYSAEIRPNLNIKHLASPGKQTDSKPLNIVVIGLMGLAPSLYMENVRLPMPKIGYILIDLPAYYDKLYDQSYMPDIRLGDKTIAPVLLLHADHLAYRHLWYELRYETTAATTRAIARSAAAIGMYSAMSSNKNTESYAELASILTTLTLDIAAYFSNDDVRNWDTLPAKGCLAIGQGLPGEEVNLTVGKHSKTITLPNGGNGIIVLISHLPYNYVRIDYAAY